VGRGVLRVEGELLSCCTGVEALGPLNNDRTSIFGFCLTGVGGVDAGGVDDVEGTVEGGVDDVETLVDEDEVEAAEDTGGLPLSWLGVAGRVPKDLTLSVFIEGTAAGEEETGAVGSFIEPNVTEGLCFADPTLFRGMLTPSLKGTL
jgi:hypothetical protein